MQDGVNHYVPRYNVHLYTETYIWIVYMQIWFVICITLHLNAIQSPYP